MWNDFLVRYGTVLYYVLIGYAAAISLASVIVTIADKVRAKQAGKRRVPENTLLLLSALGGSAAMLITMLLIRHKTRHIKFMLGIPIIMAYQAVLILYLSRLIAG